MKLNATMEPEKKTLEIVEIENTASAQDSNQKERAEAVSNDANHGNSFVLDKELQNTSFVQLFKPKYPRETMSEPLTITWMVIGLENIG